MSHPSIHHDQDEHLELKPRPRHPFELGSDPPTPTDTAPSSTFPDSDDYNNPSKPSNNNSNNNPSTTPSRNRSFLNLTSSTLFGIYGSGLLTSGSETIPPTPLGEGSQTPYERRSFDFTRSNAEFTKTTGDPTRRRDTSTTSSPPLRRKKTLRNFYIPLTARLTTLFLIGTLYGTLISHLHDHHQLSPTPVALNRQTWTYTLTWGLIGAALGEALPWADVLWAEEGDADGITNSRSKSNQSDDDKNTPRRRRRRETWLDAVRSIGLFVGIAFAIRKLPWQSTLQLSLTLALANPAVWYLVDRSPPGFILSTVVALGGTVIMLGMNPDLLPGPTATTTGRGFLGIIPTRNETQQREEFVWGGWRLETVGVATWIASVFFVGAVCLGNVGRRLVGTS